MADCEHESQLAPSKAIRLVASCLKITDAKAQQILFLKAAITQPVTATVKLSGSDEEPNWASYFDGSKSANLPDVVASIFQELASWDEQASNSNNQVAFETGDIVLEVRDQDAWVVVQLRNLRFDRDSVEEFCGANSAFTYPNSEPAPQKQRSGGRPSHKHGSAIAAVTLKLSKLSMVALDAEKNITISAMLADEYRSLGAGIPSEQTRDNFAGQIRRAIKSMRMAED